MKKKINEIDSLSSFDIIIYKIKEFVNRKEVI